MLYQTSIFAFATEITKKETQTEDNIFTKNTLETIKTTQTTTETLAEEAIQQPTGVLQEFSVYSVSCSWKNGGIPNFTCSPVWNPDNHSYDQWKFSSNDTILIQNNSTHIGTIKVSIAFLTAGNIKGVFQFQDDFTYKQELVIDLEYGATYEVGFSIFNTSTPVAQENSETQIGIISCKIIGTESQEQTSTSSDNKITTQEEFKISTELDEPIESTSEKPVDRSSQLAESFEIPRDVLLEKPSQDNSDTEQIIDK